MAINIMKTDQVSKQPVPLPELLSTISRKLLSVSSDRIHEYIGEALQLIKSSMDLDRSVLAVFSDVEKVMLASYIGVGEVTPKLPKDSEKQIPWIQARARAGEVTHYSDLEELPKEAAKDKDWLLKLNILSMMVAPVNVEGVCIAALTFETIGRNRTWSDDDIRYSVMLADALGNALSRQNAFLILQSKDEMLQKAQSVAHIGSWSIDIKEKKVTCSEEVCRIFGLPGEPVLTYDQFAKTIHPDDREDVKKHWMDALEKGSFHVEYRILVENTIKWVSVKTDMEFDQENTAISAVGTVQDITEFKKAVEEGNNFREELMHVTRTTTMGELSATIAHEINQPLAAIMNYAQTGSRLMKMKKPDLGQIRDIFTYIVEDNKRAADVIHKARGFLKKSEYEFKKLNINDVIQEVITLMRSDMIVKNVILEKNFDKNIPFVWGERIQLQQVVLNFIKNALEVMDAMKVARERKLFISTMQAEPSVIMVRIKDSGPGIDKKNMDSIFAPFFSTKKEGLGLGLSICKTIVEAHGGKIGAENNADKSAAFYFSLPMYNEEAR
jgi:two-component system sensor kinase FixL